MEIEIRKGRGEWQCAEFCSRDIQKFLEAIEDDNPLFLKEKITPPTFFTLFRKGRPEYDVKGFKVMFHAGQEYVIKRLPKVGELVKYRSQIKDTFTKKKGKMLFVVIETEFKVEEEEIAKALTTLVYVA